jgi:hypothetical protein
MQIKTVLAIFAIAASMVTATTTMFVPALAAKDSGSIGLEKADPKVHENTPGGPVGQQDVNFHVGLCQGGHSTAALEQAFPGGCSNPEIPSPSELGSGHSGR